MLLVSTALNLFSLSYKLINSLNIYFLELILKINKKYIKFNNIRERMQTKLTEHVTEPYNESNNFKNTIEINNQTNLNENDFETNSNFNTPKSKRIKMTITLEKQLSNRTKFNELPHLFTQKYSPFLSMSLPNKKTETFKYKQLKRNESDLNTSRLLDTDEFDIIDLTISPESKDKLEQSPMFVFSFIKLF